MKFTFNFPDLGEGLDEGTILEWYVNEGDPVKVGDPIVQMETDKVVADIPSPKEGTIAARHGNVGDVIRVGSPLVVILLEGAGTGGEEAAGDEPSSKQDSTGEKQTVPIQEPEDAGAVVGTMEVAGKGDVLAASDESAKEEVGLNQVQARKALATPVARVMAKQMGIDINQVPGSGPSGRVKKADIHEFKERSGQETVRTGTTPPTQATNGDETYLPLTQIRKAIARNMLHSKLNAAHMSVFEEVEISRLMQIRASYKEWFAGKGVKLTYLPFIVKAVAQALKRHPQLNSRIDMENNRIVVRNRYHIGIAVDAPDGLVVPVVRDADRLTIFEIAREVGDLAERARARKLTLSDMKEGCFSITSFGSIGGIFATPVLNYPQAGILGVGRILKTPIVKEDEIVIGNVMPLSLTVDHRVVDGGETTRFIKRVMEALDDPVAMLMEE